MKLHYLIGLFLAVAILGITAKYIAVMVSSASAGNAIDRKAVADLAHQLDVQRLTAQLLNGMLQPARLIGLWKLRKAMGGRIDVLLHLLA